MNVEFEKALQYINLGEYDKAIAALDTAIMQEEDAGNDTIATEYRCVLGELYVQLDMEIQARDELTTVVEYCDKNNVLEKQRKIAKAYLNAYDGIPLPKDLFSEEKPAKKSARPGHLPMVLKPTQDKAFIAKQMNKKRR